MRLIPSLLALAALATPALAQSPNLTQSNVQPDVLTGRAAYGDWHDDAPGRAHLIRPEDLPAPYATKSVASRARAATPATSAAPQVPPGFTIARIASGLSEPRTLRTAPDGTVFLAESGAGRIRILRPSGAQPATMETFAEGLDRPYGIAFWPPGPEPRYVYVGNTSSVVRYPWHPGTDKPTGPAETIIPKLPTGGHWTRDLAISPDGGALFVAVGSNANIPLDMPEAPPGGLADWQSAHGLGAAWGADTNRAQVLMFEPNGTPHGAFASGLRNCSGLTTQPNGSLWCVVNERDGLGDNLPPDYATRVLRGAFYGWPWYYIGNHQDPRLQNPRPDLAEKITVPMVLIQPHSAPLGIVFYTGTTFPASYRGDAFVTLHGSWNRGLRTGYKVIRLRMHNGQPTGVYEDFLTGFVTPDDKVWGRPVGITMAPDGSLLVSEDENGTVWRIAAVPQ